MPEHNPVEIYCPLPPQFYYTDSITNEPITRTLVLFGPVVIRTLVMWTMFAANLILILIAIIAWTVISIHNRPGVRLLQKLPSVLTKDKTFEKSSDLRYLMELVYVNRNRLQFVKYAN